MDREIQKPCLFGIILAGGSGSRLWPLSRESYPKSFLKLIGRRSLLQTTVSRIEKLVPPQNIFLVAIQKYLTDIKTQLNFFERQKNGRTLEQIIIEPLARNTAPAIGLAALHLFSKNPESVMMVFPSDHLIKNEKALFNLLKYSLKIAVNGYMVTLGITPDYPETDYGYIKKADLIDRDASGNYKAYLVEKFFEKPDIDSAKKYLASGEFFWNSGIFIAKSKVFLEAIKASLPSLYETLFQVYTLSKNDSPEHVSPEITEIYNRLDATSFDKAVVEKTKNIAVIPADIGWSDIGTWDKIHQVLPKDVKGNSTDAKVIQLDCENSLIHGDDRLIVALGLKDTVVVDTDDALLICRKDKTGEIKHIFNALKKHGAKESFEPKIVTRPWGSWSTLLEGPSYKIKKIVVIPGQSSSLQLHRHRSEHWVVINGQAQVQRENEVFLLNKNQSAFIPVNSKHRFLNPGEVPLEIVEVQNGEYLGEDDIVRFDDNYGRA